MHGESNNAEDEEEYIVHKFILTQYLNIYKGLNKSSGGGGLGRNSVPDSSLWLPHPLTEILNTPRIVE